MPAAAHSPDDLKCLLCGKAVNPPLVHPTLTVQRADGYDSLTANSFFVHDGCARAAAHAAVASRVRERLDDRT